MTRRGWTVLVLIVGSAVATPLLAYSRQAVVTVSGLEEGEIFSAREPLPTIRLHFDRAVGSVAASINGASLVVSGEGLERSVAAGQLPDGEHTLVVVADRGRLAPAVTLERHFVVDTTAPSITILQPSEPVPPVGVVQLLIEIDDPDAVVTVGGAPVNSQGGRFGAEFPAPPETPVSITATDHVGNSNSVNVIFDLALPGMEGNDPIRGVHASGYTWATPVLKGPIMEMIAAGLINTVEIDLKDEQGEIWWPAGVTLAEEIDAITELWDLADVVKELHALGVRVIGRLVVFRDPKLANWAIANNRMELVVQNPDGTPYGQYGGFTNLFHPEVWEYNMAIAEEAARLGVDDILYDYVRRPDQHIELMRFPGQGDQTPSDAIVGFLAASRTRIHAAGARLGASVFGIAATRPHEIAQDIPRIGETVDYVAPMVYPSHWGPGEYGVADPNSQPYDIVYRSMVEFQKQLAPTGATVVVWLQDFSLGVDYGTAEVRAQIEGAADAGVLDFLLWDAATTYTTGALTP
ncbi:MAG: putative glycoside hydrolase [Actinomycetota bacterium]